MICSYIHSSIKHTHSDEEITGGTIIVRGVWISPVNSLPVPLVDMTLNLCDFMEDLGNMMHCPVSKGEYHIVYDSRLPDELPKVFYIHCI